ncbi:hypothetical protein HMPREF0322_01140 [Desulfitobacterium hafniense DP7]|uniref:Uncharacterized protein n=1 Tax=Desulfitobacterium hafniense DP7 TaxID=537010 RepID=G9XJK9_DESHA|nr:hypothetical protein HMPREF0322_01140 [Desulfitobacterium hafniense DP7]
MDDNAVLPFGVGFNRTNPQAFRVLAMVAGHGDKHPGGQGKIFFPQLIDLTPTDRGIALVFILAGHFTASAADTFF